MDNQIKGSAGRAPLPSAGELRRAISYDPLTGEFTWLEPTAHNVNPGDKAGYIGTHGYRCIGFGGKGHMAHRIAWAIMTGAWPNNQIDHANRNKADNRWANLRSASASENMRNRGTRRNSKSGTTGVIWDKRLSKWQAMIFVDKKCVYLGLHSNIDDAIAARRLGERQYHGGFAYSELEKADV